MPQPIRVVIADDHRLMLKAVRMAMEDFDDIDVVGEARTGAELLPLVAAEQPYVALVDVRMPDMDGLTALERIRARYSGRSTARSSRRRSAYRRTRACAGRVS